MGSLRISVAISTKLSRNIFSTWTCEEYPHQVISSLELYNGDCRQWHCKWVNWYGWCCTFPAAGVIVQPWKRLAHCWPWTFVPQRANYVGSRTEPRHKSQSDWDAFPPSNFLWNCKPPFHPHLASMCVLWHYPQPWSARSKALRSETALSSSSSVKLSSLSIVQSV